MAGQRGRRWRVEHVVSAGGVVYRGGSRGLEVILCGRDADGVWGLPKGTPNPGESLEGAALREVGEETGLQVAIQGKVGTIQYWFANPQEGIRYRKIVHHYLMVARGGRLENHDQEYDRVEWLAAEEACKVLTYANEVSVVRKAVKMVQSERAVPGGSYDEGC
ncbi:MAG: NUDIX hydrolase [Dehalococcoidia bacterium]